MPKAGDVCENCRKRWEKQGMEPKVLVDLDPGENGTKATACPYCDGSMITIHSMGHHEPPTPV
jgi:hypothetical protein